MENKTNETSILEFIDLKSHMLDCQYNTKTSSAGVNKEAVINVKVDISVYELFKLAQQEIIRKFHILCRKSDALVQEVSQGTKDNPYIIKVSDLITEKISVNIADIVTRLEAKGMTAVEIIAELKKHGIK